MASGAGGCWPEAIEGTVELWVLLLLLLLAALAPLLLLRGGPQILGGAEQVPDQGGLAGAEEAGDQRDRQRLRLALPRRDLAVVEDVEPRYLERLGGGGVGGGGGGRLVHPGPAYREGSRWKTESFVHTQDPQQLQLFSVLIITPYLAPINRYSPSPRTAGPR